MDKLNPATLADMPNLQTVVKFVFNLKQSNWDLHKTLQAEAQQRGGRRWCQTCVMFVAVYAVLTGQDHAFGTKGSKGKHVHNVATLYGQPVDYARDQYNDHAYVAIQDHLKPTPKNRRAFLMEAREMAAKISKHPWATTMNSLLVNGFENEAKQLNEILPKVGAHT